MEHRVLLPVKRFRQRTDECAICASASLANYYDENIVYKEVRKSVNVRDRNGMYTAQQAKLLNQLGFECVTIVTNNLWLVDYSWSKLSKKRLICKLNKLLDHIRRSMSHCSPHSSLFGWQKTRERDVKETIEWLESEEFENRLIIDSDFQKRIKKSLNRGHPVGAFINATAMFKLKKGGPRNDADIKGEVSEHAIVLRGYDSKSVFVVDSDYSGDRKHRNGYYKITWESLLSNMSDYIILVG